MLGTLKVQLLNRQGKKDDVKNQTDISSSVSLENNRENSASSDNILQM